MKTAFADPTVLVAAEESPLAKTNVGDTGTAPLYQIAIIAAAVLLVVSAAFV